MKRFLTWTTVAVMLISTQNTMALGVVSAHAVVRGAIQNAPTHVVTTKVKRKIFLKSRLLVSNRPFNPESEIIVDDSITLARNRNKIGLVVEQEKPLSDHVKIRLLIARLRALEAYKVKWG